MIDEFKDYVKQGLNDNFEITDNELIEALEETAKDIIYNYLIFKKDVPFEVFFRNLKIYLKITKK